MAIDFAKLPELLEQNEGMQNDAPSRRVDVTEPNDLDEFRRQERQVHRWRMTTEVIDVLTALALIAIVTLVLQMIFF